MYIKDERKEFNNTACDNKDDRETGKENKIQTEKENEKQTKKENDKKEDKEKDNQTDREGYTRGKVTLNNRLTPHDHWQAVHLVSLASSLTFVSIFLCISEL